MKIWIGMNKIMKWRHTRSKSGFFTQRGISGSTLSNVLLSSSTKGRTSGSWNQDNPKLHKHHHSPALSTQTSSTFYSIARSCVFVVLQNFLSKANWKQFFINEILLTSDPLSNNSLISSWIRIGKGKLWLVLGYFWAILSVLQISKTN